MPPPVSSPSRRFLMGYLIAPLHLLAGYVFPQLPGSMMQPGRDALYGALLVLLGVTAVFYGRMVWLQVPRFRIVWQQVALAALAAAVPFFTVDFNDPWHAIVYPLILGGSLVVCLAVGHAVLFIARP